MRIFLLLLIIFINVSVLCFAKEFFPDEEISDEVVSYLDKVVRASLSPPLTENEKTKKILSPEEIRLAIEHGRLVKMMFICGMDGEKEFNSFLIEGLKKGWKVRQAAYASYLQHASMQYYGDILTNQGCTPAVKQYFSENRIAQGAQKFQFPLPGQTLTGPRLQKDALQTVMMAAALRSPACTPKIDTKSLTYNDLFVTDTSVSVFPDRIAIGESSKPSLSAWEEIWTVNACGKIIPITITFIPDRREGFGTTFKVKIPKDDNN